MGEDRRPNFAGAADHEPPREPSPITPSADRIADAERIAAERTAAERTAAAERDPGNPVLEKERDPTNRATAP